MRLALSRLKPKGTSVPQRHILAGCTAALITASVLALPSTATAAPLTPTADQLTGPRISEVESSDGTPGDWVEFFNPAPTAVDLSGYTFRDSDDTHSYLLPEGSIIAPGGYLVLDELQRAAQLSALTSGSARLTRPGSSTPRVRSLTATAGPRTRPSPTGPPRQASGRQPAGQHAVPQTSLQHPPLAAYSSARLTHSRQTGSSSSTLAAHRSILRDTSCVTTPTITAGSFRRESASPPASTSSSRPTLRA